MSKEKNKLKKEAEKEFRKLPKKEQERININKVFQKV